VPTKPSTPNTKSTEKFRQTLLQQEQELQQRMSLVVEQGRETTAETTQDIADQAVNSYQKEILFTRGSHEHVQLQHVRQALARLQGGTFGICVRCDEPIGAKRLEALPWTPYCIACQEELEQQKAGEPERLAS
jgi:DnaK suppressor protein